MLETWVATSMHPIGDASFVERCRKTLDTTGALVLAGFFRTALVDAVLAEVDGTEDAAFYASTTHNVWLTDADPMLGDSHVFNRQIVSTKGLLADDQVHVDSPLRAVYDDAGFREFVAAVVGVESVHAYADDLSSVNVHFHRHGEELGWHFDNSGFAVTALMQAPEAGGTFEFVPALRDSAADEQNFDGVEAVLNQSVEVSTLDFSPGDLVLFRGRDSMHRVTPSLGDRTRVLVVFAFNDRPGIALSDSARQTFYGRRG